MRTRRNANRHKRAERRSVVRFLRGLANHAYESAWFGDNNTALILRRVANAWAAAIAEGAHER